MAKIITVWSVNGGTGKTTVAVNLATSMANKHPNKNVLIVDFNLFNPDACYMLGTELNKIELPLETFTNKEITFETIQYHVKNYSALKNLFYLPGMFDLNNFEKVKLNMFNIILEYLRKTDYYDYVFVDINSSFNIDATFAALNRCNKLVVVGEPTWLSTKNIIKTMESIISKIVTHNDIIYVFNKLDKELISKGELDYIFGVDNTFAIEYSKNIQMCLNKQKLPVLDNSKALKNIRNQYSLIVEKLCIKGDED